MRGHTTVVYRALIMPSLIPPEYIFSNNLLSSSPREQIVRRLDRIERPFQKPFFNRVEEKMKKMLRFAFYSL
jgi:hypothetical protein